MSQFNETRSHYTLPPELWHAILSNICDDTASLSAFALTSHAACQLARPYMFRDIVVSCTHKTKDIDAFITFIPTSPHIASCVRTLTLRWRPSRAVDCQDGTGATGDIDMELLLPILAGLPGLRRLFVWVRLCVTNPDLFDKPVADLDYLHLDWHNSHAPTSCTPVSVRCLLSLFGTVGELSIVRLPSKECTCVPRIVEEDDHGNWYTDEYFHQMSLLPTHSLSEIGTRIRVLNASELGGDFSSLLVPKMIQNMGSESLAALTSVTLRCLHPKQVAAYRGLLRLCGPRLLHCRVEEGHYYFFAQYGGGPG